MQVIQAEKDDECTRFIACEHMSEEIAQRLRGAGYQVEGPEELDFELKRSEEEAARAARILAYLFGN